jgi:hypothetical protein
MNTCETLPLFFDEPAQLVQSHEYPPGTWEKHWGRYGEVLAARLSRLAEAARRVAAVPEGLRPLFEAAITDATRAAKGKGYSRGRDFAEIEERNLTTALFALGEISGVEMKERGTPYLSREKGFFVEGVGSLIARCQSFRPAFYGFFPTERAPFFLPSYRDSVPAFPLSENVWASAYSAVALAESEGKPAPVRVFTFRGRQYVTLSCCHFGGHSWGGAWTFCRIEDWKGKTYTRGELVKAWSEGRIERGDDRGLVVSVNRQRCVLDGMVMFFDEKRGDINGKAT